jgi:hypothetical protein
MFPNKEMLSFIEITPNLNLSFEICTCIFTKYSYGNSVMADEAGGICNARGTIINIYIFKINMVLGCRPNSVGSG